MANLLPIFSFYFVNYSMENFKIDEGDWIYEDDPVAKAAYDNFGIRYMFPWQRMVVSNIMEAYEAIRNGKDLSQADDVFCCFQMKLKFLQRHQTQMELCLRTLQKTESKQRGEKLRQDRCERRAFDIHAEHKNEQRIKPDIQDRT